MNNERIYYSHEAEMYAMRDRTVLAMLFLTFGMGIGAIIALLFAPTTGKAIRHQIANKLEDGIQQSHDVFDPLVKGVEDQLQTERDAIDPMVKRVENKFDDLKKNIKEHLQ